MKDKNRPDVGTLAMGVARNLEARIREGLLPVGHALASERELATEFHVSRGVIRAAIAELSANGLVYNRPHHRPVVADLRRAGAPGARNLGAWLWPSSSHFSAATILKGVQSANIGPNTQVIVASGAGDDWNSILDSEAAFLESMAEDSATMGVILWYLGGERNLSSLQKLHDRQIPLVFVDRMPPIRFDFDYVGTNNVDSAIQAVQHLVKLGHRRIGMISNIDPASSVADREEGYRRALADAGLTFNDDWIQRVTYDATSSVAGALQVLLGLADRPTAIFCVNDQLGFEAHEVLGRMGVAVPEELSLIGFDGLLSWIPGGGHLTTMRQDFERIGSLAANLIHERSIGPALLPNRHYLLDAPLMLGGSTAPPALNLNINRNSQDQKSTSVIGDQI